MEKVGLSPALGTFVAGVVLAENEYRHELEGDIAPFKGLLLGLFFIAVGASIDFGLVASKPAVIAGLLGLLLLIKLVVLGLLAKLFKMKTDQGLIVTFALAQGGEFAFVLFSFATANQVLPTDTAALLTVVVALSMALTPLMMLFNERILLPRMGVKEKESRPPDQVEEKSRVIVAGAGRFGSVVVRLLRTQGIRPTVLEGDPDSVDMMRRLGLHVYYGDATREDLLEAAGIAEAKILVIALDDPEKSRQMVATVKKHWPHIEIIARAAFRSDSHDLQAAGVKWVFRQTLDSSLKMGVRVLRELGVRAYTAERAAATFRAKDEQSILDLGKLEKGKGYISRARAAIASLENQMQKESQADVAPDHAWSPETLRTDIRQQAPKIAAAREKKLQRKFETEEL